jgi:hypothetical protein
MTWAASCDPAPEARRARLDGLAMAHDVFIQLLEQEQDCGGCTVRHVQQSWNTR